jgi:hypothetical protein
MLPESDIWNPGRLRPDVEHFHLPENCETCKQAGNRGPDIYMVFQVAGVDAASHPEILVEIVRLLQNPSRRPPAAVATRGSARENGPSARVSVHPDV